MKVLIKLYREYVFVYVYVYDPCVFKVLKNIFMNLWIDYRNFRLKNTHLSLSLILTSFTYTHKIYFDKKREEKRGGYGYERFLVNVKEKLT